MSEPLAHVAGEDAADELGAEGREQPHHAERFQPHLAEVVVAGIAFVELGEALDLVADLAVGGEVAGAVAVFDAKRRAALRLAVKYSDSCRSYINRAASSAICLRIRTSAISCSRRGYEAR